MINLVIIGAGDSGREIAAFIEDINKIKEQYSIVGFLDKKEKQGKKIGQYEVIGEDKDIFCINAQYNARAVIAMQDGSIRKRIVESVFDFDDWETIVHPSAIILDGVRVGKGSIIGPNVCISVNSQLGRHCYINIGASIGHDCLVGNYASVMGGAVLCGHVRIGEKSYVATNASIIPGVAVGNDAKIGVGSVALNNVPDGVTVYGNPGRIVMRKEKEDEKNSNRS